MFVCSRNCSGMARALVGSGLAFLAGLAHAEYAFNIPHPVSPIAASIYDLHNLIFAICLVIFVVVFGVMCYSIVAHRKSRGHQAATFHDNFALEIAWTVIPFLILVGMAIPSTATLIDMEDMRKPELTVKITGYQWKWRYEYPDHDVSFFSNLSTPRAQILGEAAPTGNYLLEVDHQLVLPTGKKIRFLLTANDVLHAWWVPALGVKKDAIPGFINEMWTRIDEPGVYRGQCAELCGKDHGFMPIVINAVSPEEFDKWITAQKQPVAASETATVADTATPKLPVTATATATVTDTSKRKPPAAATVAETPKSWTRDELLAKGQQVYQQCAACHGPSGEGIGPFPKLTGSAIVTGPVAAHLDLVLQGKPGTAMPAFGAQLNDVDIAAVVTYERNALGNNTGDVVQSSYVKARR